MKKILLLNRYSFYGFSIEMNKVIIILLRKELGYQVNKKNLGLHLLKKGFFYWTKNGKEESVGRRITHPQIKSLHYGLFFYQ